MMKRSDFEIMAPVGSYDSLTAAIQGGADSVYFGIEGLNMRARSSNNFTIDDLHEGCTVVAGGQAGRIPSKPEDAIWGAAPHAA